MNYSNLYNTLISHRIANPLIKSKELYVERHHIIPRCIGGDDSKENLVNLTAREHFIAHRLLAKMYPEVVDLRFAVLMMTRRKSGVYTNISTYRYYAKLKTEHAEFARNMMSGRIVSCETRRRLSESKKGMLTGEENPFFGMSHTEETRKIISDKMLVRIQIDGPLRQGIRHTEETRQLMSDNCLSGDLHPMRARPELARAHGDKLLGVKKSQEHRDKIAAANKGKPKSESHVINLCRNTYALKSPSGEEFAVVGSLVGFCLTNNLSMSMVERSYLLGGEVCVKTRVQKSTKSKNTVGWSCTRFKK